MLMKIQKISDFNEIKINENYSTLVLCDIDDTVIKYNCIDENWWNTQDATVEMKYKKLKEWESYIKECDPEFTCNNFLKFYKNVKNNDDSDIIFITARAKHMEYFTHKHLDLLDIPKNNLVYHLDHNPKGHFIYKNINFSKYKEIIFIDNDIENINSVNDFFGEKIKYYLFEKNNL